jgi:hypothetical protein
MMTVGDTMFSLRLMAAFGSLVVAPAILTAKIHKNHRNV